MHARRLLNSYVFFCLIFLFLYSNTSLFLSAFLIFFHPSVSSFLILFSLFYLRCIFFHCFSSFINFIFSLINSLSMSTLSADVFLTNLPTEASAEVIEQGRSFLWTHSVCPDLSLRVHRYENIFSPSFRRTVSNPFSPSLLLCRVCLRLSPLYCGTTLPTLFTHNWLSHFIDFLDLISCPFYGSLLWHCLVILSSQFDHLFF